MFETKRPLKAFLCHASQDKPAVRELSQRLVSEGWIDTWLDEKKILPGQDWRLAIEEAVEDSDIVIICLSNNSVSKEGHIQKELRYTREIALEKPEGTIFIIPLRLDECEVPRGLRFYQWVDYFGERKNDGYDSLTESLKLRYEQKIRLEQHARLEKARKEREVAEKNAREKTEKETAEKIRLQIEQQARQRAVKEKAERETAEKSTREKEKIVLPEKLSTQHPAACLVVSANVFFMGVVAFVVISLAIASLFDNTPSTLNATPTSTFELPKSPTRTFVPVVTFTATTPVISSINPTSKVPDTYTLKAGEFTYCIARRFNVDPDELLRVNKIASPDQYYVGLTLTIPQGTNFLGSRALANHPTTYTVLSSNETMYSVACKFGDVFPEDVAALNGLSINSSLSEGQKINIP